MKTLRIIGAGVKGALHLTCEAITNLAATKKILWLGTTTGFKEFLIQRGWKSEEITSLYENGAFDSDNYLRIKSKVLADLKTYSDIALVVLGHPRLGVSIVQEFKKEDSDENLKLIVLPGISSFDTMINDLELDPIEEGTCLLDVNRLLLYDYHMDLCLNYFIYHICSIGNSSTDYINPNNRNRVSFLKEKLLKHFPSNHEITLISSSVSNQKSTLSKKPIYELEILLKNVSFSSTLFIPGLLPTAEQVNRTFLNLISR